MCEGEGWRCVKGRGGGVRKGGGAHHTYPHDSWGWLTGKVGTRGRGNPTHPSATKEQKNTIGMESTFLNRDI